MVFTPKISMVTMLCGLVAGICFERGVTNHWLALLGLVPIICGILIIRMDLPITTVIAVKKNSGASV
jgi:hypothetical protein